MKKVIIGIHGLGNKPPKYLLKKWWKDSIKEGFKKNGFKNKLPEFEMVYWADILHEKPLNRWQRDKKHPFYLEEPYKKSPANFVVKDNSFKLNLVEFVSTQLNKLLLNKDKTLNYRFISEFIIENFFEDLNIYYNDDCPDENDKNCKAKILIRQRLIEVLDKYQGYEIMLLAHSMGSIVAYDVLTFLRPDIRIHTLVTIGAPLGAPIVLSKIAEQHSKHNNGQSYIATPPGVSSNWFNLSDIDDKVALNYKLGDDFNPNEDGVYPTDFLVVNDYEVNNRKNPHKSFGYLRTEKMSKILSDFINRKNRNLANKVVDRIEQLVEEVKEGVEIVKDRLNIN